MLKRQQMVCSHCRGQIVTGHIVVWFFEDVSGESFLVHGFCRAAFEVAHEQQEVPSPMSNDNQ